MSLSLLSAAIGGLAVFILGMRNLSDGLQRAAGGKVRHTLERFTGNRLIAALLGSTLSSLLQSGSAASILVVSFINAGLLSLYQALAVLIGTGIGTTIAVQLIAFRVSSISLPLITCGVLLKYFCKSRKLANTGEVFLGIGLLFLGLQLMETAFEPARDKAFLHLFDTPLFGSNFLFVVLGALFSFAMQSGSASVAIAIALAASGTLPIDKAAFMVVGESAGTGLMGLFASLGGSYAARRAMAIYFLLISLAISMAALALPPLLNTFPPAPVISPESLPRQLANIHTIFNLAVAGFFLPLIGILARQGSRLFPSVHKTTDIEPRPQFLDNNILNTPSIAFLQVENELTRMAQISEKTFNEVSSLLFDFDAKKAAAIKNMEQVIDILHRDISHFLVDLARSGISIEHSIRIPPMLQIVSTLEHIGDESEAILIYLQKKKESRVHFSDTAMDELKGLAAKVSIMVNHAVHSLNTDDSEISPPSLQLLQEVREAYHVANSGHIKRLRTGKCTVTAGIIFSDIMASLLKIAEISHYITEMRKDYQNVLPESLH
jgi:phosphate:Na+ symporter